MTQIDALKELAEKVEAGEMIQIQEFNEEFAWLGPKCFAAYANESLDAAHSLHKAVLGDRWKYKIDFSGRVFVEINDQTRITSGYIDGSPARAWLLAVIRAKISELGGVL